MRKKQLFAILLAGAMTAGTVPSAALAAENDIPAASSEVTEGENSGEIPQEEGGEPTPEAEPTQTPETTPEAPTETPAEPTETPTVPETPAEPTQVPETETTPEAVPSEAPETLENEPTGISITTIDENNQETVTYYKTLQEAVDAAPTIESGAQESTVIEITDSLALSGTISVSGKKVSIVAASQGITIRREQKEDGTVFNGTMFTVAGQGSELQFSVKDGSDLTVDGSNGKGEEEPSEGSLADVSDSGAFGISAGVTLTGNNTTAKGGAVSNSGGSLVLKGGTITGNTGAMGAVYSNTDIAVQGTVAIKENTGANLYLDQDASVVVTDVLTGSSISLTAAAPADKKTVARAGKKADGTDVTSEEFKAAAEQLAYDTEDYSVVLGEDGLSAVLKKKGTETDECPVTDSKITGLEKPLKFFPGKAYSFTVIGAGQDNTNPTEGDVRWQPLYWSSKEKPKDEEKQTSWNIQHKKGIKTAGTHKIYVFFKKQIYSNSKWTDTDTIEYVKTSFQSAKISDEEWNNYVDFLGYQSNSEKWRDHNTVNVKVSTTRDCKWYYFFVDKGTSKEEIEKKIDKSKATREADKNTSFDVVAKNVPEKDSWLIVAAKAKDNGYIDYLTIKMNMKNRPGQVVPTVTTRAPRKYEVTESKVTGLENPLQFYPRKFYDFQVVGAGQNDTDPVSGDERWIPLYWSMSVNGTKNKSWRIGSQEKGIREAATYPLYIFFQKQTYNGTEWTDTDVIEYMKTSFSSAEISDAEWKDYIDNYNKEHPDDGLNYDGTSGGSVADIKATEAASEKDSDSTSKSAVSTADESPIGTMSVLAAFSLLAGGYVLVRKRKKEDI